MATTLENLEVARDNIAKLLADITASPKPSYSVDGQSVSWESYVSMLATNLEKINQLIIVAGGPYEAVTQAVP